MKKLVILTSFMMLMASNVSAQLKVTSVNHRDCPYDFLIVKNNGRIKMALGKEFQVPVGVTANIVSGEIK